MTPARTFVFALLISTMTGFAIPQLINYQGYVTDASGIALDTTVAMTFGLYDGPGGGANQVWSESKPVVNVQNGLFNTQLGSVTPLPDSLLGLAELWLSITIGDDSELNPRTRITSVAYSYRVGTVDGASGGTITSDVIVAGKTNFGFGNTNTGGSAFVTGSDNSAGGAAATISGGESNSATGNYSVIGGGAFHNATANGAAILGGEDHMASGLYSTVGGGYHNEATRYSAAILGGGENVAADTGATVGGGRHNRARGSYAVVAGGGGFFLADSNSANGSKATVSGGGSNRAPGSSATVCGGAQNVASGNWATVAGGLWNAARYEFSFAAGYKARANHDGAFVWGSGNYSSGPDSTTSITTNSFTARCPGGARFITATTGAETGVSLAAGDGAWASLCDKNQKNFHGDVNTANILQEICSLPLHRWSYKAQDESIQHIGPTAQDFHAAFGLGDNNTTISTLDPDGVALAAIQELAKENIKLQTTNLKLEERIARLEAQLQSHIAGEQQSLKEEK